MDRNLGDQVLRVFARPVALRKESVDRNTCQAFNHLVFVASLSARRAWIEITL